MKHLCQGTKCHTYETQSRVRGTKGNKVLRTRNARYDIEVPNEWVRDWETYFCDERCLQDWLSTHLVNLMNYVGIKTKPQESPIDIVEKTRQDYSGREYTYKTINKLNENNVLTENPI